MRAVLWILVPLALIAGVAVPIQFAANARMGGADGGPATAAAISFFVGTAALLLVVAGILLVGRGESPAISGATQVPWWAWSGGFGGVLRDHVHNPDPATGGVVHHRLHHRRADDRLRRPRPLRAAEPADQPREPAEARWRRAGGRRGHNRFELPGRIRGMAHEARALGPFGRVEQKVSSVQTLASA